jgi:hypothetical protein
LKLAERNKTAPVANHCSQQASSCSQDKKHNYHYSQEKKSSTTISVRVKQFLRICATHTHKSYTSKLQGLRLMHTGDAREYDYSSFGASALPHQHRAL